VLEALRLDDTDGVDFLPNEEIFAELPRMGYEKPSTKLTFYKVFFSAQWKFLIHTILQCMSAKRIAWNEFSSSMASTVICLATVDDLSTHNTEYTSPVLTQKVFDNMRRIGKGFSRVDTLLFDSMLVQQQVQDVEDAAEDEDDNNEVSVKPTPPSPIHIAQSIEITKLKQKGQEVGEEETIQIFKIKDIKEDADEDVNLVDAEKDRNADVQRRLAESQSNVYHLELQHAKKVLSMQDTDEAAPAEVEVVTAAKLMTEVVTTATTIITVVQMPKGSAPRKRRGVVIQDPKETATTSVIVYSEVKSKDKGKGILIKEPKPLKRQAQIKQDKAFARQIKAELNAY
nr:hypothetical protein [Tanacetum cinerariifolium]